MSTSSGSLLTTSPTATSSLLLGLATYGFLGGGNGLLFGGDLCTFEDNRGRPHVGCVGRVALVKERETPEASEGVGETVRLKWLAWERWRREGSIDLLPGLLSGAGLEVVEDRLMVRCREEKVELKSLEVEAMGPETDLFEDTTESLLEERFGMGTALWETLLVDADG